MTVILIISQLGILIKKSTLNNAQFDIIKKKLTIVYKKYLGKRVDTYTSVLYRDVSNEYLSVARFSNIKTILTNMGITDVNYVNKLNPGTDIDINCSRLQLRPHQAQVVQYLLENVYNGNRIAAGSASCNFIMDTGLGKTYVSLGLLEKFRKKTLILIPNTAGLADWITAINNCFPNLKLGQYCKNIREDGDIVIMTMQSALKSTFKFNTLNIINQQQYFKLFGFLIIDEIHSSASEKFQNVFWNISCTYNLGITATPNERQDKMDDVYIKHFGRLIFAKDIENFGILPGKFKGIVRVIKYYGPSEYTGKLMKYDGSTDVVETIKMLIRDKYRNQILINEIIKFHENNRNAFIFAEYLILLKKLMEVLAELQLPFTDYIKYTGGASTDDKKQAEDFAKLIFTTYGFSSKSVSIIKTDAELFASPRRNNLRQILGRATRLGSDENIVRLYTDLVDMDTPLVSQYADREKVYREKGYIIETEIINYKNVKISPEVQLIEDKYTLIDINLN